MGPETLMRLREINRMKNNFKIDLNSVHKSSVNLQLSLKKWNNVLGDKRPH